MQKSIPFGFLLFLLLHSLKKSIKNREPFITRGFLLLLIAHILHYAIRLQKTISKIFSPGNMLKKIIFKQCGGNAGN